MPEMAFPQTYAGMVDALNYVERAAAVGDPEIRDRLVLVAGEVLANAVEHGGEHPDLDIVVQVDGDDHQLDLIIREPQGSVETTSLDQSALPDDLLAESGRGLFLIRTLSDAIAAESQSGGLRYSFRRRESL